MREYRVTRRPIASKRYGQETMTFTVGAESAVAAGRIADELVLAVAAHRHVPKAKPEKWATEATNKHGQRFAIVKVVETRLAAVPVTIEAAS